MTRRRYRWPMPQPRKRVLIEPAFRAWYAAHARRLGTVSDPDDPEHKYNYRAAYVAGAEPGPDGHWPSTYKAKDHPNRYVRRRRTGFIEDTLTGRVMLKTPAQRRSVVRRRRRL